VLNWACLLVLPEGRPRLINRNYSFLNSKIMKIVAEECSGNSRHVQNRYIEYRDLIVVYKDVSFGCRAIYSKL
jgi:hypothetical protein